MEYKLSNEIEQLELKLEILLMILLYLLNLKNHLMMIMKT